MVSRSEQKKMTGAKDTQLTNLPQFASHQKHSMYSSVVIEGFRLFEHLELNDLAKVNFFFGPNNSGKTCLLEAIYTHASGLNFGIVLKKMIQRRQENILTGALDFGEKLINLFRDISSLPYTFTILAKLIGDSSVHKVTSTFHPSSELSDLDPRRVGLLSGELRLTSQTDSSQSTSVFLGKWQTQLNNEVRELELLFPPLIGLISPFKQASIHDILSHRHPDSDIRVFSHLKRYGILSEFTREMQRIFPEVCEIDTIPYPDGTQSPVYIAVTGGRRIPLYAFGDGMRRWFYLLGQMLVYQNTAHCIEEIDSAFHPAAHPDLARLLIRYADQFQNQLFLTSHSIEFTDTFLDALYGEKGMISSNDEDPVRIFTVKHSAQPELWSLSGREAYEMRRNYELELR